MNKCKIGSVNIEQLKCVEEFQMCLVCSKSSGIDGAVCHLLNFKDYCVLIKDYSMLRDTDGSH